jgi:MarR family 2-MHQ and catechol resistance regulon transcriptional repressor
MVQFEISAEGHIREADVHEAVSNLKQFFPELDPLALEATLMLERTHALMVDARATYWAQYGITAKRFILLRHLYLAPGRRLSMGEIATVLNAGTPNVTQIIGGLVRDDLVARQPGEDDKRVIFAVLTAKGAAAFESVFTQNAARLRDSWTPLTDKEKQQLVNMLARLRIHLLAKSSGDDARDLSSFSANTQEEAHEPRAASRTRRRPADA